MLTVLSLLVCIPHGILGNEYTENAVIGGVPGEQIVPNICGRVIYKRGVTNLAVWDSNFLRSYSELLLYYSDISKVQFSGDPIHMIKWERQYDVGSQRISHGDLFRSLEEYW